MYKKIIIVLIFMLMSSTVYANKNKSWVDYNENMSIYKINKGDSFNLSYVEGWNNIDYSNIEINGEKNTKLINSEEIFFGLNIGPYLIKDLETNNIITIIVCDNNTDKTPKITRGIFIANYDYYGYSSDLNGPQNDIKLIKETIKNTKDGLDECYILRNPSFNEIADKLFELATITKSQDELYFYYSGHGGLYIDTKNSYFALADGNTFSSTSLKTFLDLIKGEKKIIIDACHSGGFINKGESKNNKKNTRKDLKKLNESFIETFSMTSKDIDHLNEGFYKVITACHSSETSIEKYDYTWNTFFGIFTKNLAYSCGFLNKLYADLNNDEYITTAEIKYHIDTWQKHIDKIHTQNVQIYPENAIFFEYKDTEKFDIPDELIIEDNIEITDFKQYHLDIKTECDDFFEEELFILNFNPEIIKYDSKRKTIQAIQKGICRLKISDYKNADLTKEIIITVKEIKPKKGKRINNKNKMWTIEFNNNINEKIEDLSKYIKVYQEDIEIEAELNKDKNKIYIKPIKEWKENIQYSFIINKSIFDENSSCLKEDYNFYFYYENKN